MKKYIVNTIAALALSGTMASCGDSYLETDIYDGIDIDNGLNSATNVETALNGAYYQLCRYYFAGNYAISIGDIVSDISYWNGSTGHFNTLYQFNYSDTDLYLGYIWEYGYKVVDNTARVIKAGNSIYDSATDDEKTELDLCLAEAYALRAYANLALVNVYAHQVKVDGTDYSSSTGIVIVDEPVQALSEVSRSTVGECYDFIVNDLKKSIEYFNKVGADRGQLQYFNKAAALGLLARTYLYLEDWSNAGSYASQAIAESGINGLAYTASDYKGLYNSEISNTESLFALAINSSTNWSANSCGTLWSTYDYSPSPYLLSLYGENDVRKSIMDFAEDTTPTVPKYAAGKFAHYQSGNSAYGTNYLINASEMYLIMAEAYLKQSQTEKAKSALLVVAKRNTDITSENDLPSSNADLMQFIKDERARELFQEGHRLWDLRRWNEKANVYAYNAPNISFTYTDYEIAKLVFPIPSDEINAGFGVEQNSEWSSVKPK